MPAATIASIFDSLQADESSEAMQQQLQQQPRMVPRRSGANTSQLEIMTPIWEDVPENSDILHVKEKRPFGATRGNTSVPQAPELIVRLPGSAPGADLDDLGVEALLWDFGSAPQGKFSAASRKTQGPIDPDSGEHFDKLRKGLAIECKHDVASFGPPQDDGYRYATLKCAITRAARIHCKRNHIALRLRVVRTEQYEDELVAREPVEGVRAVKTRRISVSEKAMCPRACDVQKKFKTYMQNTRPVASSMVQSLQQRLQHSGVPGLAAQNNPASQEYHGGFQQTGPTPRRDSFAAAIQAAGFQAPTPPYLPFANHSLAFQSNLVHNQDSYGGRSDQSANTSSGHGATFFGGSKKRSFDDVYGLGSSLSPCLTPLMLPQPASGSASKALKTMPQLTLAPPSNGGSTAPSSPILQPFAELQQHALMHPQLPSRMVARTASSSSSSSMPQHSAAQERHVGHINKRMASTFQPSSGYNQFLYFNSVLKPFSSGTYASGPGIER